MKLVKFCLKTLSPVHIRHGLSDRSRRFEDRQETYQTGFFEERGMLYRVDQEAVRRELFNLDPHDFTYVRAYADYLSQAKAPHIKGPEDDSNYKGPESFLDYLKRKGLTLQETDFLEKIKGQSVTRLGRGPFMSGALPSSFYIPGSSIKGALRTAVLYWFLNREPALSKLKEFVEVGIASFSGLSKEEKDSRRASFSKEWTDEYFRRFPLRSLGERADDKEEEEEGALKDLMKAVHVSDSSVLAKDSVSTQLCIIMVNRNGYIEAKKDKRGETVRLYVECFAGTCDVEIGVDEKMLACFRATLGPGESLPFSNVDDLIDRAREYTGEMWKEEQKFYASVKGAFPSVEAFYDRPLPPTLLRVGWGSGLPGTTVIELLRDEALRKDLRDQVISPTGPRLWRSVPSSRRLVVLHDNKRIRLLPFGWVELKRKNNE